MIELSRFQLYYFSEVSADLLYRYRPEYDLYKISATHPRDTVTIGDWFHFVDVEIDEKNDPLSFESPDAIEPLARMADTLSPAPEHLLQRHDVEDERLQFFTDFMCALAHGQYSINDARSVEYEHPAGKWLYDEYEKL